MVAWLFPPHYDSDKLFPYVTFSVNVNAFVCCIVSVILHSSLPHPNIVLLMYVLLCVVINKYISI